MQLRTLFPPYRFCKSFLGLFCSPLFKSQWCSPIVLKANLENGLFSLWGRGLHISAGATPGFKTVVTLILYLVGLLTAASLARHGSVRGCRSHGFAERAYRSHILLSVRPRQAPGLGRLFTMEGVSLLPRVVDRTQTTNRWWVQRRRLRRDSETGVLNVEVRVLRAGAAAGTRTGGRLP